MKMLYNFNIHVYILFRILILATGAILYRYASACNVTLEGIR
jgi:hypothetical protein